VGPPLTPLTPDCERRIWIELSRGLSTVLNIAPEGLTWLPTFETKSLKLVGTVFTPDLSNFALGSMLRATDHFNKNSSRGSAHAAIRILTAREGEWTRSNNPALRAALNGAVEGQ
jgi:hypothetical protein